MDGTTSTPTPEQQPRSPEAGTEKMSVSELEAKAAPAAAEAAQNGPKTDDGAAVAQAQIAAVATDDNQSATAKPSTVVAPVVAEDVDVIEPEWVKRAEEAVAANRDDPRAEDAAVEALQVEYLKTRYNLNVKPSEEKP